MSSSGCAAPTSSAADVRGGDGAGRASVAADTQALSSLLLHQKPPVMKGSYDLYARQLQTYLMRMNAWRVVSGDELRPDTDLVLQADWDVRDGVASNAILDGIPRKEANRLCKCKYSADIWRAFTNQQTQRSFANLIDARRQFYDDVYSCGKDMCGWLDGLDLQRAKLKNLGNPVADYEYVMVLIGHVWDTHRDVVFQFSKHYDRVTGSGEDLIPAPTFEQVKNVLHSEAEGNKHKTRREQRDKQLAIMYAQRISESSSKQQPGKGKFSNKRKRNMKKTHCFNCNEIGHWTANCPLSKQKKLDGTTLLPLDPSYKRF